MKPIPTETATDVGSVGKWLSAAAAGALLMYLLDPERGSARRSRAASALRTAGARTGATVDNALHSAGDRLVDLKDSATNALSRGADRLQTQTAPMLDRARHGVQEATRRLEHGAGRAKAHAKAHGEEYASEYATKRDSDDTRSGGSPARYNSYESDRYYAASREGGGLSGWLRGLAGGSRNDRAGADAPHPALVGGGMLGLLSLMRRSPGGLLVGLAGLALLLQSTRAKTYRVTDNIGDPMLHSKHADEGSQAPHLPQPEQSGSRYLH
ncbi:hypothetical protein IM543_15540 [Massilia sp. UMI-21]|nr:hypothetical protein IM543_15540 [Massilia sp. UMI-21]